MKESKQVRKKIRETRRFLVCEREIVNVWEREKVRKLAYKKLLTELCTLCVRRKCVFVRERRKSLCVCASERERD